jgi:hypothetical protein
MTATQKRKNARVLFSKSDGKTNGREISRKDPREKKSRRCPRVRATREVTLPSEEGKRRERPLFVRRSHSLDANRFFFLPKSGALR